MKSIRILAVVIVLAHLALAVPHGMAHDALHIPLQLWQNVYIWIVITILPLLSALLIWKRPRAGFMLLLLSMAGSFVFGLCYHFIAAGPDNVASIPLHASKLTFQWTSVLLAVSEAAGTIVGFLGWSRSRQS